MPVYQAGFFELGDRNGFLKSLFDGEPNLFPTLKSLFELSAYVDAGLCPERAAASPCDSVSVCYDNIL